ncbi:hypothetical protein GCM10027562_31660 [Arthrobacter pigmenti]
MPLTAVADPNRLTTPESRTEPFIVLFGDVFSANVSVMIDSNLIVGGQCLARSPAFFDLPDLLQSAPWGGCRY